MLNPFVWSRAISDPDRIVGRDAEAREVALMLKAETNVALFAPRGLGKSTFCYRVMTELRLNSPPHAGPWQALRVNCDPAISLPALTAVLRQSMLEHPDAGFRRAARRELSVIEQELAVDARVVRGRRARTDPAPVAEHERLTRLLRGAVRAAPNGLAVILDEFQRLQGIKDGDPLRILRAALMDQGPVSVVMSGSIRQALELLLDRSHEPFFAQAHRVELRPIARHELAAFLDGEFARTGKPLTETGIEHLLNRTRSHPKRTQHLAWTVWQAAGRGVVDVADVDRAHAALLETLAGEFEMHLTAFEDNDRRALQMLADVGPGADPASRARYGFDPGNRATVHRAVERLYRRALTDEAGVIVDPLFADWLRARSPFARRTVDEAASG